MKITEIKKELMKEIKYMDGVEVKVTVFEGADDNDNIAYFAEIGYHANGGDSQSWLEESKPHKNEAAAMKRAQAVLKQVNKWFEHNEEVEVIQTIESYTA